MSRIAKFTGVESGSVAARGWGERRAEAKDAGAASLWGDGNALELGSGDGCTAL